MSKDLPFRHGGGFRPLAVTMAEVMLPVRLQCDMWGGQTGFRVVPQSKIRVVPYDGTFGKPGSIWASSDAQL